MRRTIVDLNLPSAADALNLTRSAAKAWVDRYERQTGSKMTAYEMVAQMFGTSPSWLRKFVNGSAGTKHPNWIVGWNLLASYHRLCERVEQAAENERVLARALQRQIDAVTTSAMGMVDGAARAASPTETEGLGGWLGPNNEKS